MRKCQFRPYPFDLKRLHRLSLLTCTAQRTGNTVEEERRVGDERLRTFMTNDQLEAIKRMSVWEITKKYLPMKNAGMIDKRTYDFLISLANTSPEAQNGLETNENVLSEETTHDDEMAGRTQKERLLGLLKDKEWHSTVEIMEKVYGDDRLGLARVGARVYDLKKDGYHIESERLKDSVWQYRLL